MKKLKLNLDEIKVESFETSVSNTNHGTIIGFVRYTQQGWMVPTCDLGCVTMVECPSDELNPSCDPNFVSCVNTCNYGCN